jgi:hypothetical protein
MKTNKIARSTTQMYLDFGQKSFGTTKTCDNCGLFYVIDDEDDIARHKRFCKTVC